MTAPIEARQHALYRFFDGDDVLLYIGITVDPPARFKKHSDEKEWWSKVARIAIEPRESRSDALAAEKRAIQAERPRWNIVHARPAPPPPVASTATPELVAVCHGCRQVTTAGVVHVPMREIHERERAHREWKQRQEGRLFINLSELMELPDEVTWAVHCNTCNPHYDEEYDVYCGGCYWFDVDRCRTWADLITWTTHLSEKDWLKATNWMDFIGAAARGTQATGIVRRNGVAA